MLMASTQEMPEYHIPSRYQYYINSDCYHCILIGMSHRPVYKPPVIWCVISIVLAVIDDIYTLVLGTGHAGCT